MDEIWKDIPSYEGFYQASNLGRVKSLERIINCKNGKKLPVKEKIIKPIFKSNGYYFFNLSVNGNREMKDLHRIIAEVFILNPLKLKEVNHKDEIKTNNSINNLEWCDRSYNRNYGTCQERIVSQLRKKVVQMDMFGNFIKEWGGVNKTKSEGFIPSKVCLCCNGLRKSHKNYTWKHKL